MNIIAKFREEHPTAPFIFAVSRERLKLDCSHLTLITTVDRSYEWGYRSPRCSQNDYVNRYAFDHGHLLSCLGCPFYESTGREVTQVTGDNNLDKKTKRKLKREARKRLRVVQ